LQRLRSSPQPLQSWECMGASLETELPLEFVEAELAIMPLPLQHTTGDQAAGEMLLLSPFRARLTARQGPLILADPEHFRDLGTPAIQAAHLRGRQRQAIGGRVLLAISDHEHCEAAAQPTALSPVGVSPMVTHRVAIEPPILFDTAHERPAIVANPLPEGCGGIPGIKAHGLRAAAQAMASIAEELQGARVLCGA